RRGKRPAPRRPPGPPHLDAIVRVGGYGTGPGPGSADGLGKASGGIAGQGGRDAGGNEEAMILRSLRSQLTLALLVVILICSALVGIGTLVILRAEQDFQELAEQRIPRVALAGELAEISAELAALSADIVAWHHRGGARVAGRGDAR